MRGLTGRTSKVCHLWLSCGPSSVGPGETEACAIAAGARPGPPPAALAPSTLVLAGADNTLTSQRLTHLQLVKKIRKRRLSERKPCLCKHRDI